MPKKKLEDQVPVQPNPSADLVAALVAAIQATKPIEKKNASNRKPGDPWQPKDGSKKLKLKRKMYQHGLLIDPDMSTNEEIELMNQIKPGRYLQDWVKVIRRRDRGIDIDYPVRTSAQRLRLVSQHGIRTFKELLERIIEEGNNPSKYVTPDED